MDDVNTFKTDVLQGRIDVDRLVDLLVDQQHRLQAVHQQLDATQQQLQTAQQRIADLEKQLGTPPSTKVAESFSLQAEEKRQRKRGKNKRQHQPKKKRGRLTTADKVARAERTEKVFPHGIPPAQCHRSHTRPVWRLEQGRAVLIAYEVYRGPHNQYGKIPNTLGRSEFGLDIIVALAHMVHVVGLSFDKACLMLRFFQNLPLQKSQVDALLNQLSRHWEKEFERLCTLLANAAVVHADETSWSLHSVWAFLSEQARVILFGVHKDAATLEILLDPQTFAGILVSDDAAVYANFTAAQKCWAHLLRKAIKLTLLDEGNVAYREFTDRLLAIYRAACRAQRDGRLGDVGRARKVAGLENEIWDLCEDKWLANEPAGPAGPAKDYQLLVNEVMRLMLRAELFTFVTAQAVQQPNGKETAAAGTNNEAERTLRGAAQARVTGRTSKTLRGARRKTILTSVLESLRVYLPEFTLASVIDEIQGWETRGRSCFADLLTRLNLKEPAGNESTLDRIYTLSSA